MRVRDVPRPTPEDVIDQKLLQRAPKGGNEAEIVFTPGRVAGRLEKYIRDKGIKPADRIFPITYAAFRLVVKKSGKLARVELRSHDLRLQAAAYASGSGVPIGIVSKVILRHANLSITQRYPPKISDSEASRWIEKNCTFKREFSRRGEPKAPRRTCSARAIYDRAM